MGIDWLKIRNEYIAGGGSYRALAEKYEVSLDAVKRRASAEGWKNERTKTAPKIHQKTARKVVERTSDKAADRIVRLLSIGDRLADCLDQAAGELDRQTAKRTVKTKEVEYGDLDAKGRPTREVVREDVEIVDVGGLPLDRLGLRQLAATLKDLRDVAQTGRTDEDELGKIAELMARLDKEADNA